MLQTTELRSPEIRINHIVSCPYFLLTVIIIHRKTNSLLKGEAAFTAPNK